MAALPVTTADGVKEHWDRANSLLVKVCNKLFPWLKQDEDEDEAEKFKRSVDELQRMWVEEWGDPRDPETQKKIWDTACALDPSLRSM